MKANIKKFDPENPPKVDDDFVAFCRFPNPFDKEQLVTGVCKYTRFDKKWWTPARGTLVSVDVDYYITETCLLEKEKSS